MRRSALIPSTCDSSIRSENLPSTGEASAAYAHARAFLEAGRFNDAVALAHRAVELEPTSAAFRLLLGVAALQGDQPALALSVLQALAVEHPTPDVLNNLGLALIAHARVAKAAAVLAAALVQDAGHYAARMSLALALEMSGDPEGALQQYGELIARFPNVEAVYLNALTFCTKGQWIDQAVAVAQAGVARCPQSVPLLAGLADVLARSQRYEEAIAHLRAALSRSDAPNLIAALGIALYLAQRPTEAIDRLQVALARRPDEPQWRFQLGVAYLTQGDFERGWHFCQWRLRDDPPIFQNPLGLPLVCIQTPPDTFVVVVSEQGFGDDLQFCRFIPLLVQRFPRLRWHIPPNLARLFRASFPKIDIQTEVIPTAEGTQAILPLMSAPWLLGTTLASLPATIPYLRIPSEARQWRLRLPDSKQLRVGLVWGGRANWGGGAVDVDRRRSLTVEVVALLLGASGIDWVSLQIGRPDELRALHNAGYPLRDFSEQITDFADTAVIIEQLDLVISADTAVAHLAGALGKPVWLLNRFDSCWRWMIDREDSPWYPTMRIFRQSSPGDWAGVIERVKIALAAMQRR